ncbi:primosomal replication protein [Glaesserella parasuis]|uniref:primosomal replication protein n=1 Tax=Glaesserella parasuis TaxID=738 RepID=UPI0021C1CDA7|nr:primosomal replication protein [Glaesserella parasuis]MCT8639913.1 primosomal replication protein [Glaesserella parasuis]MCT8649899.1 primosomal replication protein [Glaesserella parasuis]MCT8677200.1 primosomal replication protein [Glaesserella parasuis]MDG6373252.1 primosomal replication protein [Glaesserella parasuis]MDO9886079.1 primosomal replication protein [Glaesserella parasuis]
MGNFTDTIIIKLNDFSPILSLQISIYSHCFKLTHGSVKEFIQEILETCSHIEQSTSPEITEVYTQRLIEQYDALQKSIHLKDKKSDSPIFSQYKFTKSIHTLSKKQKLHEYYKALRALNEKLSWLIEQNYHYPEYRHMLSIKIQETENRKQKCLKAIEELSFNQE